MGRRNTNTRAGVRRFDNYRIRDSLLDIVKNSLTAVVPLLIGEPDKVYDGDSAVAKNLLHRDLVHSVSRSKGIATYVRDTDHLENSLKSSVFAVSSMESRKDSIDLRYHFLFSEQSVSIEVVVAIDGLEENFLTLLEERGHIAVLAELQKSLSCIPFSCLCDIDRDYLVLFPVKGLNYLQSSYHRNFILYGSAAKQNSNV